jgi:hypothetical protein
MMTQEMEDADYNAFTKILTDARKEQKRIFDKTGETKTITDIVSDMNKKHKKLKEDLIDYYS